VTPEESLQKFLMETSGGFHATDADWTTVGRDAKGWPVVKGSPADVTTPATVRMSFPKQVQLTLSAGGDKVIFPAGIQDVPVALADHWFLKASGVILAPKPAVYNLPPTPVGTASVAVKK
jgi:hypothetical protein